MKKGWKCFCTVAGGAALYAGASFVKDYRNMKKMEKRLNSLPLHQLKERLSDIQQEKEKNVITIPKDMPMLERLRVCRHVLRGDAGNRDACKC